MIAANQLMLLDDLVAAVAAANANPKIPHRPFVLNKFVPRREVNDRGGFDPNATYHFGDQVTLNNYQFIALHDLAGVYPLDPVTGDPGAGWSQPWQSCLQRIRDAVSSVANDPVFGVDLWRQAVSGSWPCQFPDINYDQLAFYYEDTGKQESVTMNAQVQIDSSGRVSFSETELPLNLVPDNQTGGFPRNDSGSTSIAVTGPPGQFKYRYISEVEFAVIVGGTRNVNVNMTFELGVFFLQGTTARNFAVSDDQLGFDVTYDQADPAGLISIDSSQWFPGLGWTHSGGEFGTLFINPDHGVSALARAGTVTFQFQVNGIVSPGRYTVRFQYTGDPNNRASGTLNLSPTFSGETKWEFNTVAALPGVLSGVGTMGFVATDTAEAPGVDSVKRVMKIDVNTFGPLGPSSVLNTQEYYDNPTIDGTTLMDGNAHPPKPMPWAAGVTGFNKVPEDSDSYTSPRFLFERQRIAVRSVGFNTSVPGYWRGKTPPVRSLGMVPFDKMPWNIFPVSILGTPGVASINKYLGYSAPYFSGSDFDDGLAFPAYAGDGPDWVPSTSNNEQLPWPKKWKPLVQYPAGYTIKDANGNLQISSSGRSGTKEPAWASGDGAITPEPDQTGVHGSHHLGVVWRCYRVLRKNPTIQRAKAYVLNETGYDDHGNRQKVMVAGATGIGAPTWSRDLNGLTADGAVTWKLIRHPAIAPAVAHITPPMFPYFWQNPPAGKTEKIPDLSNNVTDGGGNHPFEFDPRAWWIYRVSLNRIPQEKTTDAPPKEPIAVKIGCVRNGAFVSFGTFQTGQTYDAFWPVFTKNTPLCYQASERIDLQASILTCGLNYGTWGTNDYPMAAAYVNDVKAIAALLP